MQKWTKLMKDHLCTCFALLFIWQTFPLAENRRLCWSGFLTFHIHLNWRTWEPSSLPMSYQVHLDRNYGVDLPTKLKLEERERQRERENYTLLCQSSWIYPLITMVQVLGRMYTTVHYMSCQLCSLTLESSSLREKKKKQPTTTRSKHYLNPHQHQVSNDHIKMFACLLFSCLYTF